MKNPNITPHYRMSDSGEFIVENYQWATPFSNYFPGIAGQTGIPMWVYYVNRGQGISSCGFHNKDHALMEFLSFNKACQVVGNQGFRTFLRVDGFFYEPFVKTMDAAVSQRMILSAAELCLTESNDALGLNVAVEYFPLPEFSLPGLVRRVKITNTADRTRSLEILDGLTRILPHGVRFEHTKVIARHIEAMMGVHYQHGYPVFQLKQTPEDVERVGLLEAGHYYVNRVESPGVFNSSIIVDPAVLFGDPESLGTPWRFMELGLSGVLSHPQVTDSRTPCAFTAAKTQLAQGETLIVDSMIGAFFRNFEFDHLCRVWDNPGFIAEKQEENRDLIAQIMNKAFTVSSQPLLDQYTGQTFLENVMRGGMPIILGDESAKIPFYIYARQNGDLERDYHWFILEPTYLSQGNSHYRNMLQNRRMDGWFFPETEDHNLRLFMNLIQLDGYNPLEITRVTFHVRDWVAIRGLLFRYAINDDDVDEWLKWVEGEFTPGEFLMALQRSGSKAFDQWRTLLGELLSFCEQDEVGALHEGYWIDHWFYNVDMLEALMGMQPDRMGMYLVGRKDYSFFDNPDVVQPRRKKTIAKNGKVRQYHSVVRDEEKLALIESRSKDRYQVRIEYGRGRIYYTTLLAKWLCLIANKFASLDPSLRGLEMEAGKPGWCDSLNGLPGLFGSSICETLELVRTCRLILQCLNLAGLDENNRLPLYVELSDLLYGLMKIAGNYLVAEDPNPFEFWVATHDLRESYLKRTRFGVTGAEEDWTIREIRDFLETCLHILNGIFSEDLRPNLMDQRGVPYTYFINPREKQPESDEVVPVVQQPLTPFLEGPVHYLRVYPEKAKPIYNAVRSSLLFDPVLEMYRSCEVLDAEPFEIGRIQAYPKGWLENGSIYTHMEYKWLLEVLRSGLFEEFYRDLQTVLVPYHDPAAYGRSVIENCSFVVSSLFSDPNLHGQAYQPRLSGMTCEYLQMWTTITTGPEPFGLAEGGQLTFALAPRLAGWLFTEEAVTRRYWSEQEGWQDVTIPANSFAFRFMDKVLVVYHNPQRANTFGRDAVQAIRYCLQSEAGQIKEISGSQLSGEVAEQIRMGYYHRIDVDLA